MATNVPDTTIEVFLKNSTPTDEEFAEICPDATEKTACQLEIVDLAEDQSELSVSDVDDDKLVEVQMVKDTKCDKKIKVMVQTKSVHFVLITLTGGPFTLRTAELREDCAASCDWDTNVPTGPNGHTIWDLAKHQEARIPVLDVGGDPTGSYYEFLMSDAEFADAKFVADRNVFFGETMTTEDTLQLIDHNFWIPSLSSSLSCPSAPFPSWCNSGPGCHYWGDSENDCITTCSDNSSDSDSSSFPGYTFTRTDSISHVGDDVGPFKSHSYTYDYTLFYPLYSQGQEPLFYQTECDGACTIHYDDWSFDTERMSVLNSSSGEDRLWGTLSIARHYYQYNSDFYAATSEEIVGTVNFTESVTINSVISGFTKAISLTEDLDYLFTKPDSAPGYISGSWNSSRQVITFKTSYGSAYRKSEHPDNFEYPYQLVLLREDVKWGTSTQENDPVEFLDGANWPCGGVSFQTFQCKIGPATRTEFGEASHSKVSFKYLDDSENVDPWDLPVSSGLSDALDSAIAGYHIKFGTPSVYSSAPVFYPTDDFWVFKDIVIKDFIPV